MTFGNAFSALFLKSSTLVHVTLYEGGRKSWVKVDLSNSELEKINDYILTAFQLDSNGNKELLKGKGYYLSDNFYKAKGSYSCFNTCNSWVNKGFENSGLKACYWTPFDFGLLDKYAPMF